MAPFSRQVGTRLGGRSGRAPADSTGTPATRWCGSGDPALTLVSLRHAQARKSASRVLSIMSLAAEPIILAGLNRPGIVGGSNS